MAIGFVMGAPTSEQLALSERTGELPVAGAHSVGVADGGAGLPVVGWSTAGGDLRAPQFVALGYAGLTLLLSWQALRGQALTAPDTTTMLVAGTGLAMVLVAGMGA